MTDTFFETVLSFYFIGKIKILSSKNYQSKMKVQASKISSK